jgi:hypothetical protein
MFIDKSLNPRENLFVIIICIRPFYSNIVYE